jgi:flagellar hook-length control protein FliK
LDNNGAKLSDNLSGNSLSQKLNLTELQISKGQNKACGELGESNGGSSTQNGRTAVLDSRFFASNNIENPASSIEFGKFLNSNPATNAVKPSGQVSISDISKSIGEQVIESIRASLQQQDKQITILLNPPDLGRVFVKLQEQKEQIIGLLKVSKEQTKYEIEQALPQMLRILADSGIHIKRLEVQHNNQPEQQADKYQSLADSAWESAGDDFFQKGNSGNTFTSEAAMDTYSYDDTSGMTIQIHKQSALGGFVTDISINVLM